MTSIRGGMNVRARQIGNRVVLSAHQYFNRDHAWRVLEADGGYTVEWGLVNEMEPYINGRLMSGVNPDGTLNRLGAPVLAALDAFPYWIAIRAVVNADGQLTVASSRSLSVVTSRVRVSTDPLVGLRPIAMVRLREGTPEVHQIGHFDYQHLVSKTADGKMRHYFSIA